MGITEQTDAVAIVVSEEDGSISLAMSGQLKHGLTSDELKRDLTALFSPYVPKHNRKAEAIS